MVTGGTPGVLPSDVIEMLDLRVFYEVYEGGGRRKAPFEPRMMLKVLIYAYATGVFSSRKIARKLEEDRVLGADNSPQHRTLCDFLKRHLTDFQNLFIRFPEPVYTISRTCLYKWCGSQREAELVCLGTVAIDGTKVRANASKRKAMSYARLQQEERRLAQVAGLREQAWAIDNKEDGLYGADRRGDELPEELQHRQPRLGKIRAANARLEAAQRAADKERGRHEGDDRKPPGHRGPRFKRDCVRRESI